MFLAFGAVYIIWGTTYLAIKIGVRQMPPFIIASLRYLIAGVLLLGFCIVKRERLFSDNMVTQALLGAFMLTLGQGVIFWAEEYISSGLTAVFIATLPVWYILIDGRNRGMYFKSKLTLTSISLGLIGIITLFSGQTSHADEQSGTMRLIASAVVLCSIALAGCQPRKSASLHVSPALERLVPSDTVVVLGINFAALHDTPVYQKLIARVPLPQLDELQKQTGLDPRRDLSEILVCSNGKTALLLVRGKFRSADLEARVKSRGMTPSNYKGHNLYGDDRAAINFLDDSTAALGSPMEVRALIDQMSAGQGGLPADLRDLLRTLPEGEQVYAALTGGIQNLNLPLPREGNLGNALDALRSVETATLGMNLSKGIDAVAAVNCKTEGDAKFVHDLLRGLVGFGRLNTPDNKPEMLKLYDAIHVTQQQSQTKATADVPEELADHFLNLWLKK